MPYSDLAMWAVGCSSFITIVHGVYGLFANPKASGYGGAMDPGRGAVIAGAIIATPLWMLVTCAVYVVLK